MREHLFGLLFHAMMISIVVWPYFIYRKLCDIAEGQRLMHATLEEYYDDDDPDPGIAGPEPHKSEKVVAFSKAAA